jgi:glucosamine-6-phosphate deaminase
VGAGLASGTRLTVCASPAEASRLAADLVVDAIERRREAGAHPVLGLATGRSMLAVYAELARRHREQGLSFRDVITFNLDEYWPLPAGDERSFLRYMQRHLFERVDLDHRAAHLPDATWPEDELEQRCAGYESAIAAAGGLDLQLLGIGRNGHIGFNEPGSPLDSRTRLVTLAETSRADAGALAGGREIEVPAQALTMGVASIVEARTLVLLAFGGSKAEAVRAALLGPVTERVPASVLQRHPDLRVLLDAEAAAGLSDAAAQGAPLGR